MDSPPKNDPTLSCEGATSPLPPPPPLEPPWPMLPHFSFEAPRHVSLWHDTPLYRGRRLLSLVATCPRPPPGGPPPCPAHRGFLPQTFADPAKCHVDATAGAPRSFPYDGGVLEVLDLSSRHVAPGEVYAVRPLAAFAVIDGAAGRLAWKVVAMAAGDPLDLDLPASLARIRAWLLASSGGKWVYIGRGGEAAMAEVAVSAVAQAHRAWQRLRGRQQQGPAMAMAMAEHRKGFPSTSHSTGREKLELPASSGDLKGRRSPSGKSSRRKSLLGIFCNKAGVGEAEVKLNGRERERERERERGRSLTGEAIAMSDNGRKGLQLSLLLHDWETESSDCTHVWRNEAKGDCPRLHPTRYLDCAISERDQDSADNSRHFNPETFKVGNEGGQGCGPEGCSPPPPPLHLPVPPLQDSPCSVLDFTWANMGEDSPAGDSPKREEEEEEASSRPVTIQRSPRSAVKGRSVWGWQADEKAARSSTKCREEGGEEEEEEQRRVSFSEVVQVMTYYDGDADYAPCGQRGGMESPPRRGWPSSEREGELGRTRSLSALKGGTVGRGRLQRTLVSAAQVERLRQLVLRAGLTASHG